MPRLALWATRDLPAGSLVGGLILAAPLGAVMSTVSSYLVVIASGLVRDVYQHFFRPAASEAEVRRAAHVVMIVLGVVAVAASIDPVQLSASVDRVQRRRLRSHLLRAGLDAGLLAPGHRRRHRRRHAGRRRHDARPVHHRPGAGARRLAAADRSAVADFASYYPAGFHPVIFGLAASLRGRRAWSAWAPSRRRGPSWPVCFCRRAATTDACLAAGRLDSGVRRASR